jgi:hypothetical protein
VGGCLRGRAAEIRRGRQDLAGGPVAAPSVAAAAVTVAAVSS